MVNHRQDRPRNEQENETAWIRSLNDLKDGLRKIQLKDSFELSFEQLYRMTYDIVREKKFRELYDTVHNLIFIFTQNIRPKIHERLVEDNFDKLIKEWNDHLVSASMFRDVLMFLDQAYVIKENLDNIYDMSMIIFRNEIIRHGEIRECIQRILCGMVLAEREGQVINHSSFKAIINMLLNLSKIEGNNIEYDQLFETRFLLESVVFYQREAQTLLSDPNIDTITYIQKYEMRKHQEKERVNKLLCDATENRILSVLDKCLIKDHLDEIIELKNGMRYLLNVQNNCKKELSILYELYVKFEREKDFVDLVSQIYFEFCMSHVERENINDADHSKLVKTILDLKDTFDDYNSSCFNNNINIKQKIEENFPIIFNQNPRMAEFLSAYIHEAMRKNSRDETEEVVEAQMNGFMQLFRVLSDKDIFERFYKVHLGKRLLIKPNIEVERKMLTKLKVECGGSFTSNLERMLKDIEISQDHMDIFNAEVINNNDSLGGIDFSIIILESGAWSLSQLPPCHLPPAPSALFELYTTFYNDKHNGRKLNLQAYFGSAMLKVYYDRDSDKRSSYLLDVSTLQMMILLLFNDYERLTIQQIQEKTNILEDKLLTSLNPLILGKPIHRVLKRVDNFTPKSPLSMENVITINDNYSSKIPRIKLPFKANNIDATSDRELVNDRTNRERGYEIDAAIVRIMKSRMVLAHRDIVSEVIMQLKNRFKPNVKLIDNRIKSLTEREYIAIKDNEPNTYVYIS